MAAQRVRGGRADDGGRSDPPPRRCGERRPARPGFARARQRPGTAWRRAFTRPAVASAWNCMPWPGKYWKTAGSRPKVMRSPAYGKARKRQTDVLRCRVRKASGMRETVRRSLAASASTPASTVRSSAPRAPESLRAAVWARRSTSRRWRHCARVMSPRRSARRRVARTSSRAACAGADAGSRPAPAWRPGSPPPSGSVWRPAPHGWPPGRARRAPMPPRARLPAPRRWRAGPRGRRGGACGPCERSTAATVRNLTEERTSVIQR